MVFIAAAAILRSFCIAAVVAIVLVVVVVRVAASAAVHLVHRQAEANQPQSSPLLQLAMKARML